MADPDELLARLRDPSDPNGMILRLRAADEIAVLRAALAARPEPGPVDSHGFTDAEHDTLTRLIDRNPKRIQQLLTLRSAATAGSATPKEDTDE
jgi:hypothetical protein